MSTESAFWWTNHDFGTTLSTESALWWTNYGSSHPTQKKPGLFSGVREIASFYGQGWPNNCLYPENRQFFRTRLAEQLSLSGKSPVLPDKVGRKVFSVLHNRYDLKVIGLVEWSADGPAQLCPRNGTFGGQTMIPTHLCPRNQHFGGQRWVEIK